MKTDVKLLKKLLEKLKNGVKLNALETHKLVKNVSTLILENERGKQNDRKRETFS